MPAAKTLPHFPPFAAYADPFRATETAMSMWSQYVKASTNAMLWWSERWMQAPMAMMAMAPSLTRPESRPIAAVIDLAQAAAARIAAETSEVVEIVAEAPAVVAEVVEAAAPALPLEPDDLTRLVGIGPKLSIALAERGVTRFEQLAAWTEEDLAKIDKALDLKGRAVRDAWVAQAKRFAAE